MATGYMSDKNKIIIAGLIITGLGALLTPQLDSKFIILTNSLAFAGFLYAGINEIAKQKHISLDQLDTFIETKIVEAEKENQQAKMFIYLSIRPIALIFSVCMALYLLSYIFFI